MTTAFDPTDKKYQVSSEFPPDKETSWSFPAEKDGKHYIFLFISFGEAHIFKFRS